MLRVCKCSGSDRISSCLIGMEGPREISVAHRVKVCIVNSQSVPGYLGLRALGRPPVMLLNLAVPTVAAARRRKTLQ